MSLEDILHHQEFPDLAKLLQLDTNSKLARVCAVNGILPFLGSITSKTEAIPGEYFYKLEEAKVLQWLEDKVISCERSDFKVNRMMAKFDSYSFAREAIAANATGLDEKQQKGDCIGLVFNLIDLRLDLVCRLLSDCISTEWLKRLRAHLGYIF